RAGNAHAAGRGRIPGLGMACAVPHVIGVAGAVAVDTPAPLREPCIPEDESGDAALEGAHRRYLSRPEPATPADRAVRHPAGAGSSVVHGALLRAVLPRACAEDGFASRQPA